MATQGCKNHSTKDDSNMKEEMKIAVNKKDGKIIYALKLLNMSESDSDTIGNDDTSDSSRSNNNSNSTSRSDSGNDSGNGNGTRTRSSTYGASSSSYALIESDNIDLTDYTIRQSELQSKVELEYGARESQTEAKEKEQDNIQHNMSPINNTMSVAINNNSNVLCDNNSNNSNNSNNRNNNFYGNFYKNVYNNNNNNINRNEQLILSQMSSDAFIQHYNINLCLIASKFDICFPFYRMTDTCCKELTLFVHNHYENIIKIFCNSSGRVIQVKVYFDINNRPKVFMYANSEATESIVSKWQPIFMNEDYCLKILRLMTLH